MSLDVLSKDILLKAEEEKKLLIKKLEEEKSLLESEYAFRVESWKKLVLEKNLHEISTEKSKVLGFYRREAKRIVLDSKSEIVDGVYLSALEKVYNFEKQERELFLSKIAKYAFENFKFSKVYCSKKDLKFSKSLFDKGVKISTSDDVMGFVFESEDGREILDMRFETIVKHIFENSQDRIQKILFH